jgi:hypothetical protein
MLETIPAVVGFLLLSTLIFAVKIPASLQKAFDQKFPSATEFKWNKENNHSNLQYDNGK